MSRIQSGIAYHTTPRGSPEEKERNATEAVRHDFIAWTMPESALTIPMNTIVLRERHAVGRGTVRAREEALGVDLTFPADRCRGEFVTADTFDR
jgi:hypothetical protein